MSAPSAKPCVLVADDLTIVRRPISMFLERRGFRVLQVQNGEEVLETLARESVDALLLDLHMPVIDGFQVLERLRERPGAPPALVYTSHPHKGSIERALALGAREVVIKGTQTLASLAARVAALLT